MPRVQLKPLDQYPFSVELAVRTTDINYRGHLGNDRLLSLIQEARVAFLQKFGFSEGDCGGTALILADTAILYLGEAFAGDVLRFEVGAGEATRCGFRLFFRITQAGSGKSIALVENGMVCFDYDTRHTEALPEAVKVIFDK